MSFHSPGAWFWVCLAIPIAVFYLWHFTSRRHEVATFALWQRALARRPAWFVSRFWLSLAVQVFILLLVIAALAQPYWKGVFAARRNIVLIVDVSASMSGTDMQPSRFEVVQEEGKRIISEMRRGERLLLISAGSLIRTEQRLTDNREMLLAAIESLKPTDGSTQIPQAVELGRRVLEKKSNPQIIVLTDGAFAGAREVAEAEDVQMVFPGKQTDAEQPINVAITNLAARPDPVKPGQYQVFVDVRDYSSVAVKGRMEVGLGGSDPKAVSLPVPAGESVPIMSFPVSENGLLSARLEIKDRLAADNEAHVFIQSHQRPVVALATGTAQADGSEMVAEQAESAIQQVKSILERDLIDVASPDDNTSTILPHAITVLFGQVPEQLPTGPVMVLGPKGSCDLWDEAERPISGPSAAVTTASLDSPLLSGVDFMGVVVEKAARLQFKIPAQTIVESASGDSLYSTIDRPEGRVAVLHVKLAPEDSDLFLRADFSKLITNAVRWLAPAGESYLASTTTGEVVPLAVSESVQSLKSKDAEVELAGGQSMALLDRTGVWTIPMQSENQEGTQSVLPSNLTDPSESDLRIRDDAKSAKLAPLESINDQPLWMLLVGVAIVLLFVEWCLYHRKVIV